MKIKSRSRDAARALGLELSRCGAVECLWIAGQAMRNYSRGQTDRGEVCLSVVCPRHPPGKSGSFGKTLPRWRHLLSEAGLHLPRRLLYNTSLPPVQSGPMKQQRNPTYKERNQGARLRSHPRSNLRDPIACGTSTVNPKAMAPKPLPRDTR